MLRDTAIFDLQKRNVEVLQEQLRQVRDRFNVGEVTRTDVAQAESQSRGRSLAGADGQIELQDLGCDLPPGDRRRSGKLSPATPVDRFSPRDLSAAVGVARRRPIRR